MAGAPSSAADAGSLCIRQPSRQREEIPHTFVTGIDRVLLYEPWERRVVGLNTQRAGTLLM